MACYQAIRLVLDGRDDSWVAVSDQSHTIARHTVQVLLAVDIPDQRSLPSIYDDRKLLVDLCVVLLFQLDRCSGVDHLVITVQFFSANACVMGSSTFPEAIIALPTPIRTASTQAMSFFSMPNPTFFVIDSASPIFISRINLLSMYTPETSVKKTIVSAFSSPATQAAARSESTFRNSNSSPRATGATTGM